MISFFKIFTWGNCTPFGYGTYFTNTGSFLPQYRKQWERVRGEGEVGGRKGMRMNGRVGGSEEEKVDRRRGGRYRVKRDKKGQKLSWWA